MELRPGLHRIGSEIVAVHLVVTDEGVTIVDAGLAGQLRDVEAELAALGRSLADVRGVVLTHGDSDHVGFAERLRADHGIPVFIHPGDAPQARGEEKAPSTRWGPMRIGPVLRFVGYAMRKGGLRTTPLGAVVEVRDGEELDLPGRPRVIALPGHSPGSIAVHSPAVDALFVGDALTTRHVLTGRRGAQPAPFTVDPALAVRSLDRLDGLEAGWVLPGHGTPWTDGVPALLRDVRAAASA